MERCKHEKSGVFEHKVSSADFGQKHVESFHGTRILAKFIEIFAG